jgi:hypothetical protein
VRVLVSSAYACEPEKRSEPGSAGIGRGCLLVALASLALQRRSARRLLMALTCLDTLIWLVAASAIVSRFARGQTHAELGGFSGRRTIWIAMLKERPTGLTEWLGIGLGDKRYKGKAIDGGWLAVYGQQGVVGVAISALLLLVVAWQAIGSRHCLLRALTLFLITFVTVSALLRHAGHEVVAHERRATSFETSRRSTRL